MLFAPRQPALGAVPRRRLQERALRGLQFQPVELRRVLPAPRAVHALRHRQRAFESCDFSQAAIADSRVDFASFKNCEIQLEAIKFQQEATPRAMVRVCRGLKLNAMSMGNFVDAGELTYLEKRYERLAYAREGAWGRWLASALQNGLWGYGERPWRLALVMVFNITLFGSLLPWLDPLPGKNWWEHVYFNAITYLTVGYGDLAPHAPLAQLLSVLCASAGIATFGLLIASVTKKIMHR